MAKKEKISGRFAPIRPKKKPETKFYKVEGVKEERPPKPSRATIRHRTGIGRAAQRKSIRTSRRTANRHPKPKKVRRPSTPTATAQITKRRQERANRRGSIVRRREGTFVGRGKFTEVENIVISPRGRPITKGVTDPFAAPPEAMPQTVQDYFLSSRAIRRRAYNTNTGTLEVIFQTGYGYQFFKVPQSVWVNWLKAQSAGRFFMKQIYGHWTGPKGSMTYHPNYNYRRIQ